MNLPTHPRASRETASSNETKTQKMPQFKFALSRGLSFSGLFSGAVTQGVALADSRFALGYYRPPFQGFQFAASQTSGNTTGLHACTTLAQPAVRRRVSRAFTLIEIMLVVAIIGILAAIVVPKIAGRSEEARVTRVQTDIKGGIATAVGAFEVDNGFYPKSLQDLLQKPRNARNWHGPYLDSAPVDPWGNAYLYAYPGKHNSTGYDLWSVGPDGKSGTADDIGNWTTQ
ncbi:MAG TPA: type II secretion system major pseudopilin GspG [Verrucomicrobiae bacterium]|nr:type II secretion system major pseudopilin GspG [Verrucomicrobiae bacterium]